MNCSRLIHRSAKTLLSRFAYGCMALLMFVGSDMALADQTPYHQTALTGPATDPDGSYSLVSYVIPTHSLAYSDVVLNLAVAEAGNSTPLLNLTNLPITATASGIPASVTGKSAGTYNYSMLAVIYGPYSGYETTVDAFSVTVTTPPPPVPSSISVSPTSTSSGSHTASWSASSGATKYILEQKKNSGSWVQKYSGSSRSKALSGLTVGSYTYRVKACKTVSGTDVCSGYKTSSAASITAPPAPSTFNVPAAINVGQPVPLSWSSVSGATNYVVYRYDLQNVTLPPVLAYSGTGTSAADYDYTNSYNFGGILPPGAYGYTLVAYTAAGPSTPASGVVEIVVPPATPSSITIPSGTNYSGNYSVSWASSSGTTQYQLEQQIGSGAWTNVYSSTGTSKPFSSVAVGSYKYRVRACKVVSGLTACSSWRTSGTLTIAKPSTPSTFTVPASDNNGAYTVSWSAATGAARYELWRRTNGGSWSRIHNDSGRSEAQSGLGNASYEYRVRACSGAGCSNYTAIKKTDVAITPPVPASISTPGTSYSGAYTVNWSAVSGSITKYDLNKRLNGGTWSSGYDGTATSKAFSGQVAGTHQYAVRACKTTGSYTSCSAWRYSSNTVVSEPATPSAPDAPTSGTNGAYTVSWNAVTGATHYDLQRQTNGGSWSTIANDTTATSKSESGLTNATYGYRVRACSAVGCSAYSAVDSTDSAIAPGVPASISVPSTNYTGNYTISWGASSGSLTNYQLYEEINNSGTWVLKYTGTGTSKAFTGMADGTYRYRVRAYKTVGSATSYSGFRTSPSFGETDAPSFTVNNVSVSEGGNLTFTVSKSGTTTLSHSVNYATANGSGGVSSSDYTSASGTLTFAAADTSKTVTVSTTEDVLYEGTESIVLNLSAATGGATIGDNQGEGTITDDDPAPSFSINDVNVSEGGMLSFTVTKTGLTWYTHSVSYATANGSAGSSDYTAKSGTLTFNATQTSNTIYIQTTEDATYENGETVIINLSSPTAGATIADSQGVGTITNDDATPSFAINSVTANEGDNIVFTVTKNGGSAMAHSISYATANGSAVAGSDYTGKSGTVSFGVGDTAKTITISSLDDSAVEGNETFSVVLSGATANATISSAEGVATIEDNDNGVPIAVIPANDPVSGEKYLGVVDGQFAVGKDGSANYQIPIEVPPGINGIEPSLNISYSSRGTNGLLGWGWRIGGLSSITRCKASLVRDGYISGTGDGEGYKYCLDGVRLVEVSANEFRTENDIFSKIEKHANYWVVHDRNGIVKTYGETQDSREESLQGLAHTWHLNELRDVSGNYYTVSYYKDSVGASVHRPDSIEYTKNAAGGTKYKVNFVYQTRPDKSRRYISSGLVVMDRRLERVEVLDNSSLIRSYNVSYQGYGNTYDGKVFQDPRETSRISGIKVCFENQNNCTEETKFEWTSAENDNFSFSIQELEDQVEDLFPVTPIGVPGDFDGDGLPEMFYGHLSNVNDATSLKYYLTDYQVPADVGANPVWYSPDPNGIGDVDNHPNVLGANVIDINGDGFDDVVSNNSHDIFVFMSNGSSLSDAQSWDNSSVESEFYRATPGTPEDQRSPRNILVFDVNGDSLPDMVNYNLAFNKIIVALNEDGNNFGSAQRWYGNDNQLVDELQPDVFYGNPENKLVNMLWWEFEGNSGGGDIVSIRSLKFADLNGDGLLDLYGCKQKSFDSTYCDLNVFINTGTQFLEPEVWATNIAAEVIYGDVSNSVDMNGDGLSDLAYVDTSGVKIALSTGAGFSSFELWSEEVSVLNDQNGYKAGYLHNGKLYREGQSIKFSDLNGDSCSDVVLLGHDWKESNPPWIPLSGPYLEYDAGLGAKVSLSMCGESGDNGQKLLAFSNWASDSDVAYLPSNFLDVTGNGFQGLGIWIDYGVYYDGAIIDSSDDIAKYGVSNIKPNYIVKIVDGHSEETKVSHLPITDESVYAKDESSDAYHFNHDGKNTVYLTKENGANVSVSPYPHHVVAESEISNGIGGVERVEYFYTGYKNHRDGYGSLGFSSVISTKYDGSTKLLKTVDEFYQEFSDSYLLSGALKRRRVYVFDGSEKLLSDKRVNWKVVEYQDDIDPSVPGVGAVLSPHYYAFELDAEVKQYDLESEELLHVISKRLYDDGLLQSCPDFSEISKQNRTSNAGSYLDQFGSPVHVVESQCDSFGVTGSHIENTNILNLTGLNWVLGLIQDPLTHTWVYDQASGDTSQLTQHSKYTFNSLGQITQELREPNAGPSVRITQSYTYNEYGTVDSIAESFSDFEGDGVDFESRIFTFDEEYSASGTRSLTVANPLGQSSTKVFDRRFGLEESIVDINGRETQISYDEVGRKSEILYPDGNSVAYDYRTCDNCFQYNLNTAWYEQEKKSWESAERVYYDKKNREIGERSRGLSGAHIYKYSEYDNLGRIYRSSRRFYASDVIALTTFGYDALDRVVSIEYPDLTTQTNEYLAVDGAAGVVTTDSLGRQSVKKLDALDRERVLVDALGTVTEFTYNPHGNTTKFKVRDSQGLTEISYDVEYDVLGRRKKLTDPDLGVVEYQYNSLGLLSSQTNSLSQKTQYGYDKLDRQIYRIDDATSSNSSLRTQNWVYDTKPGALGAVSQVHGHDTDGIAFSEEYFYDSLGRQISSETVINGESYISQQLLDSLGRPGRIVYPTGYSVTQHYNSYGFLHQNRDLSTGGVIWEALNDNAQGEYTEAQLGNGVVVDKDFHPMTGQISSISANKSGFYIQNHEYAFDSEGNLRSRKDLVSNIEQLFCYDELNRLTNAGVGSSCVDVSGGDYSSADYSYDIYGNILKKGDVSDYQYGGSAGPHAVTFANGVNYTYDNAGRMTGGGGRSIAYSSFGKPTDITKPGYQTKIVYGALQNRVRRIDTEGVQTEETIYIGKSYEKIQRSGGVEHRHYIGDFAVHIIDEANNDEYKIYFHRDHIGSLVAKSDEFANSADNIVISTLSPWGQRQDGSWDSSTLENLSGADLDVATFASARGFTNHEHLDGVGLIHMNGRVYDPLLGRFISPDPWIQDPENSQSFNRYSYVWNNPLRYTDPTGEFLFFIPAIVKAVGYGLAVYGAYETGHAVGETARDIYTGEKEVGEALKDGAVDVGTNIVITATGTRAIKLADKAVDKFAPNVKKKIIDRSKEVFDKMSDNSDKASSDLGAKVEGFSNNKSLKEKNSNLKDNKSDEAVKAAKRRQLIRNQAVGAAGEKLVFEELGERIRGRQVTVETLDGDRARIDFVEVKEDGTLRLLEVKTGDARLTKGQKAVQEAIERGEPVIPRGEKAREAGLRVGKEIEIDFKVRRVSRDNLIE